MIDNVPHIRDHAPKLTAFGRENGGWILAGLAVVVVLAIAFSNIGGPKPLKTPQPVAAPAQVKPTTPEQVRSFTQQLQKETAELAVEKQRAQAMQAQAQSIAGQSPTNPYAPAPAIEHAAPVQPRAATSNVVVSFRQAVQTPATATGDQSEVRNLIEAQKAALQETLKASPVRPTEPLPQSPPTTAAPVQSPTTVAPAPAPTQELKQAVGNRYRLFEGTLIETVLVNRLNGTFTGPVIVLVSGPVYSHDREHTLIPQGSRIIGEARRVGALAEQRLAVTFHRIVMPDGFSVDLDQFIGLNGIGETGLKDKANHHYAQLFGTSIAIGLVSGFSGFGTGSVLTAGGLDQYRQRAASSLGQSASQALEQQLTSVLPTVTIREGHRVRVFISRDVELPAYENHRVKGGI